MAQTANYVSSQKVEVHLQQETTVGSAINTAMDKLQTTGFSIPEASMPVEYSTQRSGLFVQTLDQAHHAEGTKMWTFDTSIRGTLNSLKYACDSVFEDDASEFELSNAYDFNFLSYKDGSTTAPGTYTIRFENGGSDTTLNNVIARGCVGTGFTIGQDIGSEGGETTCTINWATGYMPQ